ncbi:tapasin-related protein-like isoform X2 [Bombina bombina]|uniref:tapasin-related protein-like isoform X2 n=1 Tax=Bombina bombina TaxID=8345 RepID=UPI00235A77E7|nr:tapasin-related protein-like isoform X2 [Bombina bombina]
MTRTNGSWVVFYVVIFFFHQSDAMLGLDVHPSSAKLGADIVIPCTFHVHTLPVNPDFLAIFWYFQGKEILRYDTVVRTSHPRASLDTTKAPDGNASLLISNVKIFDSGIYKCLVIYTPEKMEKETILDVYAPPKIIITNNLVVKNTESFINCTVHGFYPIDIEIKWLRDKEVLESFLHYTAEKNSDGTYSVKSAVRILPKEENVNHTYSIRVLHVSLQEPLQKDFQLVYGNRIN